MNNTKAASRTTNNFPKSRSFRQGVALWLYQEDDVKLLNLLEKKSVQGRKVKEKIRKSPLEF